MITVLTSGMIWLFKKYIELGCFKTAMEQKEKDKVKYEDEPS